MLKVILYLQTLLVGGLVTLIFCLGWGIISFPNILIPDQFKDIESRLYADDSGASPAGAPAAGLSVNDRRFIRAILESETDAAAQEIIGVLSEEVASAAEKSEAAASSAPAAVPAPERDEEADTRLRAEIDRDLQALLARGNADSREMFELQGKIARLPPAERAAALGDIGRAINDGRLDAPM